MATYLNLDAIVDDSITLDKLSHKGGYIEVYYEELLELIEESKLISGKEYRIIDYVYTPSPVDQLLKYENAGHIFDIIVKASSSNTVFPDAKACIHENSGFLLGGSLGGDNDDGNEDDLDDDNDNGGDDGGENNNNNGDGKSEYTEGRKGLKTETDDYFVKSRLETWKLKFSLEVYPKTIDIISATIKPNNLGKYYKYDTVEIIIEKDNVTLTIWNLYKNEKGNCPEQIASYEEKIYDINVLDTLDLKDDIGEIGEIVKLDISPNHGIITEMIDQNGIKQNFDFKNRIDENKKYHFNAFKDEQNMDLTTNNFNTYINNVDYISNIDINIEDVLKLSNIKCNIPDSYTISISNDDISDPDPNDGNDGGTSHKSYTPISITMENIEIINSSNVIFEFSENSEVRDITIRNSNPVLIKNSKSDVEIKNVRKSRIDWMLLEDNVTVSPRKSDGIVVQYNIADFIADTGIIEIIEPEIEYIDFDIPGYDYIWTKYNLGASEDDIIGDYFSWGEVNGYKYENKVLVSDLVGNPNDSTDKESFTLNNYKYSKDYKLTKYCSDSNYGYEGYTDNLTTLESSDDAAMIILGGGWRIPTSSEFEELLKLESSKLITISYDSIKNTIAFYPIGMNIEDARTNNKCLDLPFGKVTDLDLSNENGIYLSSTLSKKPDVNYSLVIAGESPYVESSATDRYYGCLIRPIKSKSSN